MKFIVSTLLPLLLSVLLIVSGTVANGFAQDVALKLQIIVIEGEGATNNIRQRVAREPIVEIRDENNRPVGGAIVTFTAPNLGPSGTFQGGSKFLTTTTDSNGRAVARGFQPNSAKGQLNLRVNASANGQTATANITMTNIAAAAGTGLGAGSAKWWLIAGGVAAAGVIAGVLTTRGGSSPTPQQTTTITIGSGTVRP